MPESLLYVICKVKREGERESLGGEEVGITHKVWQWPPPSPSPQPLLRRHKWSFTRNHWAQCYLYFILCPLSLLLSFFPSLLPRHKHEWSYWFFFVSRKWVYEPFHGSLDYTSSVKLWTVSVAQRKMRRNKTKIKQDWKHVFWCVLFAPFICIISFIGWSEYSIVSRITNWVPNAQAVWEDNLKMAGKFAEV